MRHLVFKLGRFGIVGGLASLNYILFVTLCVELFGLPALAASAIAYVCSVPISYAGHRNWAFKSGGNHSAEFSGFMVTSLTGFFLVLVSTAVIVDLLGLHYFWSIAFACVAVPLATFVTLNFLVFRNQPAAPVQPTPLPDDAIDIEEGTG